MPEERFPLIDSPESSSSVLRRWIKSRVSPRRLVWLRCRTRGLPWPRWGNLRRLQPFSSHFGFERGTPVDRYYLHEFLDAHRHLITGRVLEIQLPAYTRRYGQGVTAADSVDIVAGVHQDLTYLVDLAHSEGVIPDDIYDCVLLPNTLCVLREIDACLRHALRVARPGGVVLATTAGVGPLTGDGHDLWRMGADGWRVVAERAWPGCDVEVRQRGNCLTAVAAMLGLALEELRDDEFRFEDPRYPVLVTLVCRKPS